MVLNEMQNMLQLKYILESCRLQDLLIITKTCPCNKHRFFSIKIEHFQLEKFFFIIFAQNIDCGYTLEPPRRGGSNGYPQSMFWSKIRKIGIPLHTPLLLYKSGV